ncbi:QRFP-like peptide receptor [Exaiptasia diaphana]|uniref:G-protein coupled receptors family 1 profile domain-containing protein n=1 Tax=Exaiptasia diaphana TaxID=2652724 RepID=A0A913YF05_EXADI|nr:QRFP-like peptide receptor [Exaiptasia diaphana]
METKSMSGVNSTGITETRADFKRFEIQDFDIIFGVLYGVIVLLGLIGNILVVAVVKRTPSMHTTTNFLLVNLAVADIITLLWNPRTYSFAFYPIHPRGVLGDYICKFFTGNAVISVAIGASVFTLSTVAVERYHALVKPMKRLRIQAESVKYVITVIWAVAFLITIPDFIAVHYDVRYNRCICPFSLEAANELRVHVLCTVSFLGVLPFMVLGFCYLQIIRGIFFQKTIIGQAQGEEDTKSKKKLAKLLISVTLAFYTCYLPYGTFISFIALSNKTDVIKHQDTYIICLKVVEFLVTCSSFLNPILYAFQSTNYRQGFMAIFRLSVQNSMLLTSCKGVRKGETEKDKVLKSSPSLGRSPFFGRQLFNLNRVSVASDITLGELNYQSLRTSNVSFQFVNTERSPSSHNAVDSYLDLRKKDVNGKEIADNFDNSHEKQSSIASKRRQKVMAWEDKDTVQLQ